jgi:hypothetical protein
VVSYFYDPELAPIVPLLPSVDITNVAVARANLERAAQLSSRADESTMTVQDHSIAGYESDLAVSVRVFRPVNAGGQTPALLYIHGGGFVVGSVLASRTTRSHLPQRLALSWSRLSTGSPPSECKTVTPHLGEVAENQLAACHVAIAEARRESAVGS